MLTRRGVAKKLGKSVATVRRLEGKELFPTIDQMGIHRFPDGQIIQLQEKLRNGSSLDGARGDWLSGRRPTRTKRQAIAHNAPTPPSLRTIARARAAAQRQVAVAILELLDRRQLRRLGPELTDYLASLLEL